MSSYSGGAPPGIGGGSRISGGRGASFDSNIVIMLAALIGTLICARWFNSIVRFVVWCFRGMRFDGVDETLPRYRGSGLENVVLGRIPVAVYGPGRGVLALKGECCPICLGEFLEGEKIRVLPNCHHVFHVVCVDIWLVSNSSCPTCRQPLAEEPAASCGGVVDVAAEGGSEQGHGGAGSVEDA